MLNYVNGLLVAYNAIENTVVVKFRQDEPVESADDSAQQFIRHEITSVVMSQNTALDLANNIITLCENLAAKNTDKKTF